MIITNPNSLPPKSIVQLTHKYLRTDTYWVNDLLDIITYLPTTGNYKLLKYAGKDLNNLSREDINTLPLGSIVSIVFGREVMEFTHTEENGLGEYNKDSEFAANTFTLVSIRSNYMSFCKRTNSTPNREAFEKAFEIERPHHSTDTKAIDLMVHYYHNTNVDEILEIRSSLAWAMALRNYV